jgi:hypothetical protein
MSKLFFKEFSIPAIAPGEQHILTKNEVKLSESSYKQFVPFLSISVLNKSTQEIKIFLNETDDIAFRLPPNSSRTLTGYPAWDITVQNLGTENINANEVFVTLINDLEQVSRYNASIKNNRGY